MRSRSSTLIDVEAVDKRIVAAMRLILAALALATILIDPLDSDRPAAFVYIVLSLYTLYSMALLTLTLRTPLGMRYIDRWAHWLDVGWYVVLIGMSRGTSSIFFFGFFFAILVAAFRWGFVEGLSVTLSSAVIVTVAGYITAPSGPAFEFNRFLLRPLYFGVLGYMIAFWGGREIRLRRRLALLKEMTARANPRFGVDRTTGIFMELLRVFYDADACVSITLPPGLSQHRMRRATRADPESAARVELIPAPLSSQLLAPPAEAAILYRGQPRRWRRSAGGYVGYDLNARTRVRGDAQASEELAAILDARSFIYTRRQIIHEHTAILQQWPIWPAVYSCRAPACLRRFRP
jgi:hypothetical protein